MSFLNCLDFFKRFESITRGSLHGTASYEHEKGKHWGGLHQEHHGIISRGAKFFQRPSGTGIMKKYLVL
jgi:hypothetical protein